MASPLNWYGRASVRPYPCASHPNLHGVERFFPTKPRSVSVHSEWRISTLFGVVVMPITLKLGSRKSQGASDRETPASTSTNKLPSNPHSRTVSFSEHNSYSDSAPFSQEQVQAQPKQPVAAVPQRSTATFSPAPAANSQVPAGDSIRPRRRRSPTPPPTGVAYCLPLGSVKSTSQQLPRKARRLSDTQGATSSERPRSGPSKVTSNEAHLCLDAVIKRYARLAGYDAVQQGVLALLRDSLEWYIEDLVFLSSEHAESSRRMLPNARDLLEAVRWEGQLERREAEEEDDGLGAHDGDQKTRTPWDADALIGWRHKIPDFSGEYPHRSPEDQNSLRPDWAQEKEVSLIFSSTSRNRSSGSQTGETLAASADGMAADENNEVLSERSRRREKLKREEIPSHLPELPALHTWRRTDAYPTNHLMGGQAGTASGTDTGYVTDGSGNAEDIAGQSLGKLTTTGKNSTLSRLESRLVSSRLVQTSLSALIGRLDGAAASIALDVAGAEQSSPAHQTDPGATGSPMSPTTSVTVPPSPRGKRSERERSTTQGSAATVDSTQTAAGSSSAQGRLSIRLRTSSANPSGAAGSTTDSGIGQPFSPSSRVGSANAPPPSSTIPTNLMVRRGVDMGAPALTLETQGGINSFRQSMIGHGGRHSIAPSPSPATPFTPFGGPFGNFGAWAGGGMTTPRNTGYPGTGGVSGYASPTSAVGTPATPWPFFSTSGTTQTPGTAPVTDAQLQAQAQAILPPVVNFKAGWYARKV